MAGILTPSTDSGTEADPKLPSSYCGTKWDEAIEICKQNLTAQDREQLEQIGTYDDLLGSIQNMQASVISLPGSSLLHKLRAPLESLRNFVTLLVASLGSSTIHIALIWGVMTLAIAAAQRTETLLPKTLEMLADLGHDLEILHIYESTFASADLMGDELMDIFVEIITFWTQTINFLRHNKHGSAARNSWPHAQKHFEETSRRIKKKSQQIKEKVEALTSVRPGKAADLLKELDRLGIFSGSNNLAASDKIVFPCNNIPFTPNPFFLCRDEEIAEIRGHLDTSSSADAFKSFALYGTGGIGKTQTALSFAHEQVSRGVSAVLWLDCETGLSIARSFFQVAEMLQLEGLSQDENSDQNRFVVLKWLRKTPVTWLMIMDNVEDLKLIRNAWPTASHGSVLVTSRNSIVSIDPAAAGLEIKVLPDDYGSKLLLSMVERPSYSEEEKNAAKELSARLGGLPLALAVMASQIRLRGKSIKDFVEFYKKYSQRLNKEKRGVENYYRFSIETCWQTTFEYLGEDATRLLEVISQIAPDHIPVALFKQEVLPESLEFCNDEWALDEALDQLTSTSLIRQNPSTKMIYVHRLVQEAFRFHIGPERRRYCFKATSELLNEVFPKLVNGLSMRPHWPECKKYIAHVLIVCARLEEDKPKSLTSEERKSFLELSTSCGWYLMESGAWSEDLELMRTAIPLCEDREGLLYANLTNSLGCVEYERGHAATAYQYMKESFEIRQKLLPPDHEEVANSLNNYGNLILQDLGPKACERALDYYFKCIEITMTKPKAHRDRFLHIPHTNISRALRVMKDYNGSILHAEKSRQYSVNFLGVGNHFDALADYHVGNALFDQDLHDEAEKYWKRALVNFARENETHPSTLVAKFKLGCVEIKRGHFDQAIDDLRTVLLMAQLNEPSKGDQGETARVTRKLAEAYELQGDLKTASEMKEAAEAMRKEIQGTRFDDLEDCDLSYAMMSFHAYW